MPIREDAQTLTPRIYRTFRFGDLATLFMLDTRLVGRDQEVDARGHRGDRLCRRGSCWAPSRKLARASSSSESVRSKTTWNVLGQQVMFAPQTERRHGGRQPRFVGRLSARRATRVFDMIERAKVDNLAVLTGDMHSSWAYDLPRGPFDGYDKATGKGSLGVEFAGTSVSSPSNLGAGPDGAKQLADTIAARPHLHYVGRAIPRLLHPRPHPRAPAGRLLRVSPRCRSAATKERFEKGFITNQAETI